MKLVYLGQKSLQEISKPIEEITDDIRNLIPEMFETMEKENGIGLAAPQIGINLRLFVVGVEGKRFVCLNPQILETSQETCVIEEGCLSMPKIYEPVTRPSRVKIQFMDLDGRRKTVEAEGIVARVFQHEIDHLNGLLFIDRIDEKIREKAVNRYERKQVNASKRKRRHR